jgi:protein-disulfide isomerase
MRMLLRLALCLLLLPTMAQAQQIRASAFPLTDSDGDPMANVAVSDEQMGLVAKLPGLVDVSAPGADVTLYQFYDLNCPYCREAAADVDKIIRSDAKLRLVFAPYAVLSIQSVEGARVELALRELGTPQQFLAFHRQIYATRGIIDGNRALAVAQGLGFDQKKLIEVANTKKITDTLVAHAKLGNDLKLMATPAYVILGAAILGHPGLKPLRDLIASVRRCQAVVC